jgi:hypothetical protein
MRIYFTATFAATGILLCCLTGCSRPAVVVSAEASSPVLVARGQEEDSAKEAPPDEAPFRLPNDRGGELLAKVLPPQDYRHPTAERAEGPRRLPPSSIESPTVDLPPNPTAIPRLPPDSNHKPLQPRLTVEETLVGQRDPVLPHSQSLWAPERTRAASVDVHLPLPLPILAVPVSDRASLADPTTEASTAIAVSASMPQRTRPAPYVRMALPDPFENRKPLSLPTPPEETTPVAATPKPPKP